MLSGSRPAAETQVRAWGPDRALELLGAAPWGCCLHGACPLPPQAAPWHLAAASPAACGEVGVTQAKQGPSGPPLLPARPAFLAPGTHLARSWTDTCGDSWSCGFAHCLPGAGTTSPLLSLGLGGHPVLFQFCKPHELPLVLEAFLSLFPATLRLLPVLPYTSGRTFVSAACLSRFFLCLLFQQACRPVQNRDLSGPSPGLPFST